MKLILLNGPPGIGKSTIAARYVADHPGTLNLDLDAGRDDLDDEAAGRAARAAGLERARNHLDTGGDVIVPQLLARGPFIDALERLARALGAEFHEIVLMAPRDDAVTRFTNRSEQRRRAGEPDPQGAAIARSGGAAELGSIYDRLLELLDARPDGVVISTTTHSIDHTYTEVARALGSGSR